MTREIKFRGKCCITGEFVYGDLIHGVGAKNGNLYILPDKVNLAYVKNCDPLDGVRVDPATVGQFTGLKDKSGKEIYEGDVLRKIYGSTVPMFVVSYHKERAMFIQHDGYNESLYQVNPSTMCEVVGNIHDNPELLNQ